MMRSPPMTPTWEQRAPLRGWYSSMWAGMSVFSIWAIWDSDAVLMWWPLALSVAATLAGSILGYALRVMDPVSWAISKTAFTAR